MIHRAATTRSNRLSAVIPLDHSPAFHAYIKAPSPLVHELFSIIPTYNTSIKSTSTLSFQLCCMGRSRAFRIKNQDASMAPKRSATASGSRSVSFSHFDALCLGVFAALTHLLEVHV